MAPRRRNPFELATRLGFASLHTGITLSYRLPILAAASLTPRGAARHARELNRMVTEKTAAATEGAFGLQMEMLRLAGSAMLRPLDFAAAAQAPAALFEAALKPGMRKVKANSRRLGRRR
ncbi:MAG: hypothetical protein ACRECA_14170 [Pseudolabrys sp.]